MTRGVPPRRRRALLLAGVLPLLAAAGAAQAEDAPGEVAATHEAGEADAEAWPVSREPMPFDIIRSLQFLQDQIARGNNEAIRVQALLLRRFGPVFLDSGAAVWEDARNRRAAVLFVLSGGPGEVLDGLLRSGALAGEDRALFEGALAYVRNDLPAARRTLEAIDLEGMEAGLAGHLHLVLGQMLQDEDPAGAANHLDRARLLAPGGLIEEAALRLGVAVVDAMGEHARADRLARQYLDRYASSSYAANFEARLVAVQSARGAEAPEEALRSLADIAARLPAERRERLLIAVARRALVENNRRLAEAAAAQALAIGAASPTDTERARLYATAAAVDVAEAETSLERLDGLRRDLLHPEDAKLLDAARSVAAAIAGREAEAVQALAASDAAPPPGGSPDDPAVFSRAARVLALTSDDLAGTAR